MRIEQINALEKSAREKYTYAADGVQDTWRSHADDVHAGNAWQGDCDDLASTVLDLCGQNGMPLSVRYFLVVEADPGDGKLVGHAVGCVADDSGTLWIVGDTFEVEPYLAANMKHLPVDYHRQSEDIGQWRKGAPWVVK